MGTSSFSLPMLIRAVLVLCNTLLGVVVISWVKMLFAPSVGSTRKLLWHTVLPFLRGTFPLYLPVLDLSSSCIPVPEWGHTVCGPAKVPAWGRVLTSGDSALVEISGVAVS